MLLTVRNLAKSYGAVTVLDSVSFIVNSDDRIGIVGMNGAGKTTLLRILMGQETMDAGSVSFAPSTEVGYLPQTTPDFYGRTIQDMILESVGNLRQLEERMRQIETAMTSADADQLPTLLEEYNLVSTKFQDHGGYELDYKIDTIMTGLQLAYLPRSQAVDTLSGGEKERIGLATLLLRSPDLLLLDEPTNHLDIASAEWLENYLARYKGAILMVSHDRQFLNRCVNQIFELEEYSHQLKKYEGNYDAYAAAKIAEREKWEQDYERQQEEIKELRKRIKDTVRQTSYGGRLPKDNDKLAYNFFGGRVQQSHSRSIHDAEERLKRIEADPIPKPPKQLQAHPYFSTEALQSREVVSASHLRKRLGGRCILHDVSFTLSPDARIVLVGPNGIGKTTLLKLIMGLEKPDEGAIRVAPGANIGYLPQEPSLTDPNKTVLETYRYGQVGFEDEFVAKLIGYGLFRLEDISKTVGQLSVGQRRKLEIARLLAERPNVLLLDEPTNYISLDVLEAFEAAVLKFPGPVIAVSHDRWFMQRFGGKKWELVEGRIVSAHA
jgi:macrolide transport system ATP-binding/permease protein